MGGGLTQGMLPSEKILDETLAVAKFRLDAQRWRLAAGAAVEVAFLSPASSSYCIGCRVSGLGLRV